MATIVGVQMVDLVSVQLDSDSQQIVNLVYVQKVSLNHLTEHRAYVLLGTKRV